MTNLLLLTTTETASYSPKVCIIQLALIPMCDHFLYPSTQAIKPQQHISMTLMHKLANIFGRQEATFDKHYNKVLARQNDNCIQVGR